MPLADWIPGWGHWHLGQRLKGTVVAGLFALFALLGIWHAETLWGSLIHTASKLSGAAVVYTPRDLDFLVTSLFVLAMLVFIVVYSGVSCRRKRRTEHLAGRSEGQWSIVWRQFQKNPLAVAGVVIILALYLVAFLCPFIAPYDPV